MQLTVAIPTYDRPKYLAQTIAAVLPQLTPDCRLLIIDNCSPRPVAEIAAPYLQQHHKNSVRIVRNAVNIGANANILRCVELCETEWLWTLSDDELVHPEAVARVLQTIRQWPDATYISFALPGSRRQSDVAAIGNQEFVRAIDSLRELTLISNNVYNVPKVRDFLRLAHNFCYSNLAHVALPIVALGGDGRAYLAKNSVIAGHAEETDQTRWSVVHFSLGLMTLLELPIDSDTQRLLAEKINASFDYHKAVTLGLAAYALATKDTRRALYLYNVYVMRSFYHNRSWFRSTQIWAYRWLVRYPKLAEWLIRRFLPYKTAWFERMGQVKLLECQ